MKFSTPCLFIVIAIAFCCSERAGQLFDMQVIGYLVIPGTPPEGRTQMEPLPGNLADGSILKLAAAVYTVPASIDSRRTVKLSAHVNVT
jgi:hypothetical protein